MPERDLTRIEIRRMRLHNMNAAPYNPRDQLDRGSREYERLKASITSFGYVDPLVWNEQTGNLVGGHQRYWILQDMGEDEADVSVVSLDPDREKALNLALNSERLQGQWNFERLQAVVTSIENRDLLDIVGFDEIEVSRMMRDQEMMHATDFLSDVDLDMPRATVGAPELKDDHPHRTGPQMFQLTLVFDADQRDTYFDAIQRAKDEFGVGTTMEAVVAICRNYLEG